MTHISQSSIKIPSNSKTSTNIQNTARLNKISLGDSPFFKTLHKKKHNQKTCGSMYVPFPPLPTSLRKGSMQTPKPKNETLSVICLEAGAELFELEQFRDTSSDARSGGGVLSVEARSTVVENGENGRVGWLGEWDGLNMRGIGWYGGIGYGLIFQWLFLVPLKGGR